jgi:uncharacterized protein
MSPDRPVIDWPAERPRRRRRTLVILLIAFGVLLLGGGTALSYYVDALWFESLGYAGVFWKTLNLQATVFTGFFVATIAVVYGAFLALKPAQLGDLARLPILINGQPIRLPVEPVVRLAGGVVSLMVALAAGAGMMAEWQTLALYWYSTPSGAADPIFHRPLTFYLFTLPAWQLLAGWVTTLAVVAGGIAIFFVVVGGGTRLLSGRRDSPTGAAWRGLSIAYGVFLLTIAARVYFGRFERLFADNDVFAGVTYTDDHVVLGGMLLIAAALALGAVIVLVTAISRPNVMWFGAALVPAIVCWVGVGGVAWYVSNFIVKPNQLQRERPYIANNIEMTRQAFGLHRIERHPFSAEGGVDAVEREKNQATIDNIRLWDWRALQDTLRQIQEIRTYYDFPDIDIDRYQLNGVERQVMLAARELNVDRLPESSRNWINEKLIYTHGYGVTMNPVNGFTPEGLPTLILSNMPVHSDVPEITVTRPEIYFGELTNTDVYVKTRQKEFNYPQGEQNNLAVYEGTGGIVLDSLFRRLMIALDRGDLAKLPFSDDITPESRLLMRRNIRERLDALAPFLAQEDDPYLVIDDQGRLMWMIDEFTTSESFPYARRYQIDRNRPRINYLRNAVKATVDAYNGATTFYVFDPEDPIIAAYRALFPSLFKDASAMPPALRTHVRYPEMQLRIQALVYALYHMTDPEVFYNREDLWSIATEVGMNNRREQATQMMDPNYVLMTLPGEQKPEFVEILPFTPSNRNNLIGWIAGRSDDPHYGHAIVYDFPKTRLIDGPLQVEARIDQNPQLSSQLTLWNQQGSHVRRGSLLVIPIGRALLYAEAIYLQAERSPMPELRLVVLALQDRLAYGTTFEAAMAALFGSAQSTITPAGTPPAAAAQGPPAPTPAQQTPAAGSVDTNALIAAAAKDLADYQRLTAEGKLGEAGQKLEALKAKLDQLAKQKR